MMRLASAAMAAALLACWTSVLPAQAQSKTAFPPRVCDIRAYGAKGTRIFLDTEAIQRAIDDCAARGGGTVEVPRGEFLIGPIFLKSNIRLHLASYSELVGTTEPEPYRTTEATRAYATNGP